MNLSTSGLLKWLGCFALGLALGTSVQGQAFSENFDDIQGMFTYRGWQRINNSSAPQGSTWVIGNPNTFPANSGAGSSYLAGLFNSTLVQTATGGTISIWLLSPDRTLQNGDTIRFFTRCGGSNFPDRLELRISTADTSRDVGTTPVSVGVFTNLLTSVNAALAPGGYPTTWTLVQAVVSGVPTPTRGRIALRYFVTDGGPNGNNSDVIGIDDFEYRPLGGGSPDLSIGTLLDDYTDVPLAHLPTSPVLQARVTNNRVMMANGVTVTATVFSSLSPGIPVFTATSSPVNIAANSSQNITVGNFRPAAQGAYLIEYVVNPPSGFNDGNRANDTLDHFFRVTNGLYARDEGDFTQGLITGRTSTTAVFEMGLIYDINTTTTVDSVIMATFFANAGEQYRIVIRPVNASRVPLTSALYTGPFQTLLPAQVEGAFISLPINFSLSAGAYYIGVEKSAAMEDLYLFTTPRVFKPGVAFRRENSGAFVDVATTAFGVPALRLFATVSCAGVSASASSTNAACATLGTATVTPQNALAPVRYAWSNNATTQSLTGLVAGTYTVTVTDGAGCVVTATTSVSNNSPTINAIILPTDTAFCGNNTGSITLSTPTGGTAPYTFLWSNNATTRNVSNLAAGPYQVTVSDANGCTIVRSASVVSGTRTIVVNNSVTASDCGAATGAAGVTPITGRAPHTYLWSNGAITATINNIAAGVYTVTVTDADGCSGNFSLNVSNQNAATISVSSTNARCNGEASGSINLSLSGGTAPFTYNWTNGATTASLSGLTAGTYAVTITDAANCNATSSISISQPAAIVLSTSGNNPSCSNTNNGSVTATVVSGGTAPFTYAWTNTMQMTSVVNNLGAGSYAVTVTDNNGCMEMAQAVVLTAPSAITFNTPVVVDAACNGINNGSINVANVAGGTAPYTFTWTGAAGVTTQNATGLGAGGYNIIITDALGCTATNATMIMVGAGPSPSVALTPTAASSQGSSDGSVAAMVTGGTSPYTYLWSNGATTANLSGLAAGSYTLTATDSNGCIGTGTANVADGPVSVLELEAGRLTVFPNPNRGQFNLDLQLNSEREVNIRLTTVLGQVLQSENYGLINQVQRSFNLEQLPAGLYLLHLQVGSEQSVQRIIISH